MSSIIRKRSFLNIRRAKTTSHRSGNIAVWPGREFETVRGKDRDPLQNSRRLSLEAWSRTLAGGEPNSAAKPLKSPWFACQYGTAPSAEEIGENRRDMFHSRLDFH